MRFKCLLSTVTICKFDLVPGISKIFRIDDRQVTKDYQICDFGCIRIIQDNILFELRLLKSWFQLNNDYITGPILIPGFKNMLYHKFKDLLNNSDYTPAYYDGSRFWTPASRPLLYNNFEDPHPPYPEKYWLQACMLCRHYLQTPDL